MESHYAHNITKWPWTFQKMTLTLIYDLDIRTRQRIFPSLCNYQAESRYLQ